MLLPTSASPRPWMAGDEVDIIGGRYSGCDGIVLRVTEIMLWVSPNENGPVFRCSQINVRLIERVTAILVACTLPRTFPDYKSRSIEPGQPVIVTGGTHSGKCGHVLRQSKFYITILPHGQSMAIPFRSAHRNVRNISELCRTGF